MSLDYGSYDEGLEAQHVAVEGNYPSYEYETPPTPRPTRSLSGEYLILAAGGEVLTITQLIRSRGVNVDP